MQKSNIFFILDESQNNTVVSIYTKYDILILERIVGTMKAS